MADERKVQLGIEVDASGARKGFDEVKQGARDMAQSVTQSSEQAGKGLGGIGAGGEPAAQKLDRSTKSIIASIQRTTAVMEAGERGSVKYFEAIAQQRGVSVDALRPYLDQLDSATVKQGKATASLTGMGVSAAQTTAALRQLPAQFTDIFTSLASGQAPLTVMIQQGGQIKDAFGGAGAAARALGGYVLSLVSPATIAAGAAAALAVAYHQGSKEADAYNRALIMTGNAAGTTAGNLAEMAERISDTVGTQGKAAEVLAQMAASGRIAAVSMEQFGRVAVEAEKALGIAAEKMVEDLASLGKEPVEASVKLNEKYRYLTASIYEQIKALEDQGKTEQAAALAQQAYSSAFDQRSKEVVENLGLIERGWRSVAEVAKKGWDEILGIGRQKTGDDQLADISSQIAAAQTKIERLQQLGNGRDTQRAIAEQRQRIEAMKIEQAGLQEIARMQERGAESAAANSRANEARIAWLKEGDKFLSKAAQMEREIAKARNEGATAGATQAEIEARIGAIREKYADKSTKAQTAANAEARRLNEALMEGFGLTADFYAEWDRLSKLFASGAFGKGAQGIEALSAAQARLLEKQPAIRSATQAGEKADKDAKKAIEERTKAMRDAVTAESDRANVLKVGADKMREELETLGMTAQQLAVYRIGKLQAASAAEELAASNLEEAASFLAGKPDMEHAVDLYQGLARARRDAAKALKDQASIGIDIVQKQAAVDAMNEAVQGQVAMWQSIDQTAHDTFVSIFDSGKDVFERLRDTLKNTLYDLLYQMTVRKWLIDISAAVSGQGVAQQAFGAGGGGGGWMNVASNAYSLYNSSALTGGIGSIPGANLAGTAYANYTGTGIDGLLATNGAYGTAGSGAVSGLGAGMGMFGGALLGYQLSGGNPVGTFAGGAAGVATYGAAAGAAAGTGAVAGASAALAAIPVWGWVALAAMAILAGNQGGGTPHLGAATLTDFDDSQRQLRHEEAIGSETVWGGFKGNDGLAGPLNSLGAGIANTIESTLAAFGDNRQVSVFSAFGADDDDPSRGILRVFGEDGGILAQNTSEGNMHRGVKYDDNPETGFQEFTDDAGRVIRDALVAANLPGWVDDILMSLGDAPGLAAVNTTLAQIQALKDVAGNLGPYLGVTAEGLAGIAGSIGGFDALIQSLGTFTELALTSAEKWEITQTGLAEGFDALGVAVPQSTDEFRRLIEGLDLTTDAGQDLAAGLLGLAPAFYSVANAVEDAFDAISQTTAKAVNDFAFDVMSDDQKYAALDTALDAKIAEIKSATEPGEIQRLFDEAIGMQREAWSLLSDDEKRRLLPEFQSDAMDIEGVAQGRLSVTPNDSAESAAKDAERAEQSAVRTATAVKQGVTEAMVPLLERIANAIDLGNGNSKESSAALRELAASLRGGGSYQYSGSEVVFNR